MVRLIQQPLTRQMAAPPICPPFHASCVEAGWWGPAVTERACGLCLTSALEDDIHRWREASPLSPGPGEVLVKFMFWPSYSDRVPSGTAVYPQVCPWMAQWPHSLKVCHVI